MDKQKVSASLGVALVIVIGAYFAYNKAPAINTNSNVSTVSGNSSSTTNKSLVLDNTKWNYDQTNNVYWQIGISYASKPMATDYETLGIYIPGQYLTATANADGTYTAQINTSGTLSGYTAKTAPIVFPINTPGYSAQNAPTSYSYNDASSYLKAGYIYVSAGLRGKNTNTDSYTGNAPWGVTDFKAAVRYIRYNSDLIPGNMKQVFVFGHSGGGAQSAIIGASGDSPLYTPYLEAIGAAMTDKNGNTLTDAVAGVMAWCPITSLDTADAAYEWNMGQFSTGSTRVSGTWTEALSKDLAVSYADYINQLGLKSKNGTPLKLTTTNNGIYLAGTYYDEIVATVEQSLNNFLADTKFPYTATSGGFMAGMPTGASGSGHTNQGIPPAGMSGAMMGGGMPVSEEMGGPNGAPSSQKGTTYKTVQEYIRSLNKTETWVSYDAKTNTAKVLNLAGFIRSQKNASKTVGAFDNPDRSATENVVLGVGTGGLHFSEAEKNLIASNQAKYSTLKNWQSSYTQAYDTDTSVQDGVGEDVKYRLDMYNPMYYISQYYQGYKTSTVAPYWRIRTGIMQGDTATTVEMNLALALKQFGIENVDFATVWAQAHTMAERTGNSTDNLIEWINQSIQK